MIGLGGFDAVCKYYSPLIWLSAANTYIHGEKGQYAGKASGIYYKFNWRGLRLPIRNALRKQSDLFFIPFPADSLAANYIPLQFPLVPLFARDIVPAAEL